MFWLPLDGFLTRIRPYREPLSLLLDALVIALAWQATYLFRLGFSNWLSERPPYDGAVLAGLVVLYVLVLWLLKVPKGMWRFSGFGEIKRLTVACAIAGTLGATVVLAACKGAEKKDEPPKGPQPGAPKEGTIPLPSATVTASAMPMRQLGKTGVSVSMVGLGGFHIGMRSRETPMALAVLRPERLTAGPAI